MSKCNKKISKEEAAYLERLAEITIEAALGGKYSFSYRILSEFCRYVMLDEFEGRFGTKKYEKLPSAKYKEALLADEFGIDGRGFVYDSPDGLKSTKLQELDNRDVFRTVPLDELYENGYRFLYEREPVEPAEVITAPNISNVPEISGEKHDFTITDENLGAGGPKTKYKANVEAIKLLNKLEDENRLANPEEQEILSRYVGWGGMPQVFDENNSSWSAEFTELKTLLSPDEYDAASE